MEHTTISYEKNGLHKVACVNGTWKMQSIVNWVKRMQGNLMAFSYIHATGRRESFSVKENEATLIGIYNRS